MTTNQQDKKANEATRCFRVTLNQQQLVNEKKRVALRHLLMTHLNHFTQSNGRTNGRGSQTSYTSEATTL